MSAVEFPAKLQFLFRPSRYKVAYGGRGSAKSWSFARALLVLGASKPMRVLCTREVQKSIKDSVHKLLSDQVDGLGLSKFYEVLNTEIRGKNGTEFLFAGLQDHTVDSIKSYEGVDVVWVEEAHSVSKKSWDILIPTIRKPDSEIWVSFNPSLDTDETYQRFVVNPPPNAIVERVNYSDNPWFPDVLELERRHAKETKSKSDYENIWEGKCKAAIDGAIYADQINDATERGRITRVPYDPALKVHVVWDLGWNDSMFLILVQRLASEIRVIEAIQNDHKTLDWYSADLRERKYNWGTCFLPHDGEHGDFKTGKSAKQILEGLGWSCEIVENIPVERGIDVARMVFPRVYFDQVGAKPLIESLKRYRRHIPTTTGEPASPVHDAASHGADCFRYLALSEGGMGNTTGWQPLQMKNRRLA